MTKYFSQREIGFTFIELLIVIAVLDILAAVIIPNVSGFILSGKLLQPILKFYRLEPLSVHIGQKTV